MKFLTVIRRLVPVMIVLLFIQQSANAVEAVGSNKEPVLLTANEVGYDEPNATATAIGNVEAIQGDTILLADRITYNQNTDVVYASGHVSMLQPSGDVVFSDEVTLTSEMKKGIVKQFRARLSDNSLFAAREGHKVNEYVTKMKNAVYSPCKVCTPKENEEAKAPLWQMQAKNVTVDEQAQRVSYRNAYMDVYGIPVLYTPYFSHPTPDAPSQSGLLTPQYSHSTVLGSVVKQPVYLSLASNTDMEITPWYISTQKPLLEAKMRHLEEWGNIDIHGAFTDTYQHDASGNQVAGTDTRGFFHVKGNATLNEHWDAGVDAERASDDTFLSLYGLGWQDLLTSRLYAERIVDRNYTVVESLAFQGLQPQDIGKQSPYILPQVNNHFETDPLANHSRLAWDSNVLVLERREGVTNQRLSNTVSWKLPYISPDGQVFELNSSLRGDIYNVNDQEVSANTHDTYSGEAGRFIPQIDAKWSYPLVNRFSNHSLMIAPIVEASANPHIPTSSKIPNQDSQSAELSDINLFSPNRFSGLDQVESGVRAVYGTRGQLQWKDTQYFDWLFGQAYQENNSSPFPIANSQYANYSDYIGRVAAKYERLDIAYNFRVDRQTLSPVSNTINTNLALKPLVLDLNYVSLKNQPFFGDRKQIYGSSVIDITHDWSWNLSGRKDLGSSQQTNSSATSTNTTYVNPFESTQGTVGLGTGLTFHNECLMLQTNVGRSYITQQDVKPSTSFTVVLTLKNFTTTDSPSLLSTISSIGSPIPNSVSEETQSKPAPDPAQSSAY